jgi:hypothetical protein
MLKMSPSHGMEEKHIGSGKKITFTSPSTKAAFSMRRKPGWVGRAFIQIGRNAWV